MSRHRQASWYVPGVIVRKVGQDVYAVRVRDNKIVDRDHTQLRPRAPDPSGRPVTFEFTAGDVDSDDEGKDDNFTAKRILTDKPDPGTPGARLYKVRWKGFAASRDSWEPRSSFLPRYTTVWMEYLRRKNINSTSTNTQNTTTPTLFTSYTTIIHHWQGALHAKLSNTYFQAINTTTYTYLLAPTSTPTHRGFPDYL